MSNESGGVLAANPREGFRSETLARFALSAFGPATAVEIEMITVLISFAQRHIVWGGGSMSVPLIWSR
jgi:hypothetical protein